MKYSKLPTNHCYEIIFEPVHDFTKFGERNYSWAFIRDRNIEVLFRYAYLFKPAFQETENENMLSEDSYEDDLGNDTIQCSEITEANHILIDKGEENTYVFRCIRGEFIVKVGNLKKILSEDNRNSIIRYSGASVEIFSSKPDSVMEILTREKIEFMNDDTNITFNASENYIMTSASSNNGIIKMYDRDLFFNNGIKSEQLFTYSDNMKYKDTVRGLYIRKAPKTGDEYVTCLSGSVKIFALDMRPESDKYLKSFTVVLYENDSVFIKKGHAVGIYSLENNTIVTKKSDSNLDIKYFRRINIRSCSEAADMDLNNVIISALDREAVMAEDFIETI